MRHKHSAGIAVLLGLSAILLAGCETSGPSNPMTELAAYRARAQAEPSSDAKAPPSRAQVAMDCWAIAEKTMHSASVDARGDFVTGCIETKLKGGDVKPAAARKPKPKADAKTEAKPDAKPGEGEKPKP